MKDLSIIIVSWNVQRFLDSCLASIKQAVSGLDVEVILIDNASTDGTNEWLQALVRNVQTDKKYWLRGRLEIMVNVRNKGFAAANNQGIRIADGEYVLLLNPDTECTEGSLAPMLQFMNTHPRCGVLGPRLLGSGGHMQRSVRRFPRANALTALSLGWETTSVRSYLQYDFDYGKAAMVDQVMGACFLIRRACLDEIGLLDERFFIWFEEVDYCRRAKDAGWEVWYTPAATVIHHGGESFSQVRTLRKQWMFSKSALAYFRKHSLWSDWCLFAFLVPLRLLLSVFLR